MSKIIVIFRTIAKILQIYCGFLISATLYTDMGKAVTIILQGHFAQFEWRIICQR